MNSNRDEAWRRFARDPGEANFAPLYEAARDVVYTICLRVLRSEEDARDAFQNAWTRVLALARDGETAAREDAGVVLRVAAMEANNLRKRRARRAEKERVMENVPELEHAGDSPRDQISEKERRLRIETLVNTLDEEYRQPILLHFFDGLSQRDVARALGCPPSTISWRIQRGIRELRPLMERAGLGEPSKALAIIAAGAALTSAPAALTANTVYTGALAGASTWGTGTASVGVSASTGTTIGSKIALAVAACVIVGAVVVGMLLPRDENPEPAVPVVATVVELAPIEEPQPIVAEPVHAPVAVAPEATPAATERIDTAAAEATPAPPVENPAKISGRVYDITTGIPVADATVELRTPPQQNYWNTSSSSLLGTAAFETTTDAQGGYIIEALPFGAYLLSAQKGEGRSFVSDEQRQRDVYLAAGDSRADVDVYLFAGNRIRGKVIEKESGAPIAGAEIRAGVEGEPVAVADHDGRFYVENVFGSRVTSFAAVGPDGKSRRTGSASYRQASYLARAPGFVIMNIGSARLSTQEPEVEITITMVPAVHVSGVVVDERNRPLEGVVLNASPPGNGASREVSDSSGRFRIATRVDTPFMITAKLDGYAPEEVPFDALASDQEDVRIVLKPEPPKRTISGVVRDDEGNAVAGEKLWLQVSGAVAGGGFTTLMLKTTTTDELGEFTIEVVPWKEVPDDSGNIVKKFKAGRMHGEFVRELELTPVRFMMDKDVIMKLTPEDVESGRRFEFTITKEKTDNFAGGTVLGPDGNPMEGVALAAGNAGPVYTRPNGYFFLEGLSHKDTLLSAYHPDFGNSHYPLELNVETNIVTIRDERRYVQFTVADAATGEPIADAVAIPLQFVGGTIERLGNGRFRHLLGMTQAVFGYRLLAEGYETLETEEMEFTAVGDSRVMEREFRLARPSGQ